MRYNFGGKMETVAKYAYEVYKAGSFTKAAKKLYISQPSLSASIARLEGELGFSIFDRSKLPCSLTPEGRIYIDSLEEIMESEQNMKRRIKDLADVHHGSISVGGSSLASYLILPEICSEFHKRYPKINVTLDIGNKGNTRLSDKLDDKELDVLVTYFISNPKYIIEPLTEERLVIAMNKNMKGAGELKHLAISRDDILAGCYARSAEIDDTSIFRGIEFIEFQRKSDTGMRMAKILGDYKPSRYNIQNAKHSEIHYNLMSAGIGATVTTTLAIAQKPYNPDLLFFIPSCEESYRTVYLAYHKYLMGNPLLKSFTELAKEIYSK